MPNEPKKPWSPDVERRIEIWTPEMLKDHIRRSCIENRSGVCAWENLPSEIQLGNFAQKVLACLRATESDQKHSERAAVIQWEPVREIIMTTKDTNLQIGDYKGIPVISRRYQESLGFGSDAERANYLEALKARYGIEKLVEAATKPEELDQLIREERERRTSRVIGVIHSHPTRDGFSPLDGANFLSDNDSRMHILASLGDDVSLLIANQETRWLEHDNTKEDIQRAIQEKVDIWEQIGIKIRNKIVNTPELAYRWKFDAQYREAVVVSIINDFFANVSVKYKFGYYRGDASRVSRVLPKQSN